MAGKIFIYQIILCLFFFAQQCFAHTIDDVINSNPQIQSAIIGISVKDAKTGAVIYEKNPKTLLHPASTLKIITSCASLDYLGKGYKFRTGIYKFGEKTYIKLGADPLFGYDDLYNLISQYKNKNTDTIKFLVFDDTITDKISYGEGWQWDDNASTFFPQMSPYIINRNLFAIKVIPNGKEITIAHAGEYKENVINKLELSENNSIRVERNIFAPNAAITLQGKIKTAEIVNIPALSPEGLFKNSLAISLLENNIPFNANFSYEKLPRFSTPEAIVEHNIQDVLKQILSNSDNLAAEMLLKHAGAAKLESTGTTKAGLDVVKDFYSQNGADMSEVIIVDGSGASMNDYVSADFMTNALVIIGKNQNFDVIKNAMATPERGTFSGRAGELNGKIFAKTGTLANTSAVVGYLKTAQGRDLVFAIMLDNIPKGAKPKQIEDAIIRAIAK